MRVLVIYAHPDPDSLNGAIHREILTALSAAGHEVDDIDLYAEGFDPVLSAEERRDYFEPDLNRARVADYAARIEAAEGLVFCFPTWCLGPPAILKGFFDRVMVPGCHSGWKKTGPCHPICSISSGWRRLSPMVEAGGFSGGSVIRRVG